MGLWFGGLLLGVRIFPYEYSASERCFVRNAGGYGNGVGDGDGNAMVMVIVMVMVMVMVRSGMVW